MAAVQEPAGPGRPVVDGCGDSPRTCELLARLNALHAQTCQLVGIAGAQAVLSAAAVGLVAEVWRHGPVEAMHGGRRGPSNVAMFAESTALHSVALAALRAPDRKAGLRDFEEHLLDERRPWAGSAGRNLAELGQGFLGDYRRHVQEQIVALRQLGDHTCVSGPLETYLVPKAVMYGADRVGMPGWPVIVHRVGILLADPDHPQWGERRGHQALRELPAEVTSIGELTATLLSNPSVLPQGVLDWLCRHLLYSAGPPYGSGWAVNC